MPQSRPRPVHEQFDRSFAAFESLGDFRHPQLVAISQVDRLASTLAERIKTNREMGQCLVVTCFMFARQRVQFQTELGPGDFAPPMDSPNVLAKQIAGNADQPGTNRGRAGQLLAAQITPQKDFLAKVLRVGGLQKTGLQKTVHGLLIEIDQHGEGPIIAPLRRRDQSPMPFAVFGGFPGRRFMRKGARAFHGTENAWHRIHAVMFVRGRDEWRLLLQAARLQLAAIAAGVT